METFDMGLALHLSELKDKLDRYSRTIDDLYSTVLFLQSRVEWLETKNAKRKQEIVALREKNRKRKECDLTLRNEVYDISELANEKMSTVDERLDVMDGRLHNAEMGINIIRDRLGSRDGIVGGSGRRPDPSTPSDSE